MFIPSPDDYTSKDFDSLRDRLFGLAKSVFPEWSDVSTANFGNILLEMFSHVGDVVCYYQDRQAAESRIVTAKLRSSLLAHAKLLSFVPSGAAAATVQVRFTITAPRASAVTIPAGTVVTTAEAATAIVFQTLADATILPGAVSTTTTVEQSEQQSDVFTASGAPSQVVMFTTAPYLDGSAIVDAENGTFTEVTDFSASTSSDRHFTVAVDADDIARLRFGTGVVGCLPTGQISADYKTGGGLRGLVQVGAITKVVGTFADAYGTNAIVSVTNLVASSGGANRMSNEGIRLLAPASLRARNACIAREDFEINALRIPQVARALMLTHEEDVRIPVNTGVLYILPTGGGVPTDALKAAVLTQVTVTYPCPLTFRLSVVAAIYKPVSVQGLIYIKNGYSGATVAASIREALATWFAPVSADGTPNSNVNFGAQYTDATGAIASAVVYSDIFNTVRDVSGVRKLDGAAFQLNGQFGDVALDLREFPALGTVTLTNGDTQATL